MLKVLDGVTQRNAKETAVTRATSRMAGTSPNLSEDWHDQPSRGTRCPSTVFSPFSSYFFCMAGLVLLHVLLFVVFI